MPSLGVGVFLARTKGADRSLEFFSLTPVAQVLVGLRSQKNKRAPGVWALPGGMREKNETLSECAVREVFEETGMKISVPSDGEYQQGVVGVSDHHPREDHITFWVLARPEGQEPVVKEPDKCDRWEWMTLKEIQNLPQQGEQQFWTPIESWKKMKAVAHLFD